MSNKNDIKKIEIAYQNLEKLGPWGQQSVIYTLLTTEENFRKANSKQFKSAEISPRKTYSKQPTPNLTASPTRVNSAKKLSKDPDQPTIPRTNVEDYFNRKPDKKLNTVTKRITETQTVSSFKSLPLLKVRKQLQVERKIYVMMNRGVTPAEKKSRVRLNKLSPRPRRKSEYEAILQPKTELSYTKSNFTKHFNKMLRIIDQMNQEDPIWVFKKNELDSRKNNFD